MRFGDKLLDELAIDPVEALRRCGDVDGVHGSGRPHRGHPRDDLLPRAVSLLDRHAVDLVDQRMSDVEADDAVRVLHALADDRRQAAARVMM